MMDGKELHLDESVDENATRFTFRVEFSMKGLGRVLEFPMVPMTKRNVQRASGNMKRICEANTNR